MHSARRHWVVRGTEWYDCRTDFDGSEFYYGTSTSWSHVGSAYYSYINVYGVLHNTSAYRLLHREPVRLRASSVNPMVQVRSLLLDES